MLSTPVGSAKTHTPLALAEKRLDPREKIPHNLLFRNADLSHALPLDVWAEVFLLCLPQPPPQNSSYGGIHNSHASPGTAPLVLCQVCRTWAQLAYSLPNLWSSLRVVVSLGESLPPLGLVSEWLERSGCLPLTLSLYQSNEAKANQISAGKVFVLFKQHVHRWRNVELNLVVPKYGRSSSNCSRHDAPMLERFYLTTSDRMLENKAKDVLGVFGMAPRLTDLTVSCIPDVHLPGRSTSLLPWPQLTRLSLGSVGSINTSLQILSSCPNLSHYVLDVDDMDHHALSSPLVHEKLCSLELSIKHSSLEGLLGLVTLPGLKDLNIFVKIRYETFYIWPQSHFDAFLKRSECRLLRLEIHQSRMSAAVLRAFVCHPHIQSLIHLAINDGVDWMWDAVLTGDCLALLTCPSTHCMITHEDNTPRPCLPALESLGIQEVCSAPDGAFAEMVESRWRVNCAGVARLKRLVADLSSENKEDMRRLKVLQAGGLVLKLKTY